MTLLDMIKAAMTNGASDIHLVAGAPPMVRHVGELKPLENVRLGAETILGLVQPHITPEQLKKFSDEGKLNCAFTVTGLNIPNLPNNQARFRLNLYNSHGDPGASLRVLTLPVKPLLELGLPPAIIPLMSSPTGMIIVTGATGSGKSTTLASMVDHVNKSAARKKVITIEDPIEYIHDCLNSLIVHREVGSDMPDFQTGVIESLRQDPDILVIGELRNAASIMAALLAAETGHLVLTTLHTPDAAQTISRVIAAVDPTQQEVVRHTLSSTLRAVVSQSMLPRSDKKGMVLAVELLINTDTVKRMIRENKTEQIYDVIHSGSQIGMVSKDISLVNLVKKNMISREQALPYMRMAQLLTSPGL